MKKFIVLPFSIILIIFIQLSSTAFVSNQSAKTGVPTPRAMPALISTPTIDYYNNNHQYYTYPYVSVVEIGEDGYLYVDVSGNFVAGFDWCKNIAFGRSKYPITDDRTKAMLTISMASMLGKIPITIWTIGCIDGKKKNYRIFDVLEIAPEALINGHSPQEPTPTDWNSPDLVPVPLQGNQGIPTQ